MTVTSQLSSQTFPGTGVQTNFSFAFDIPAAGDEQVFLTDSGGNITGPLASTLYAITGYGSGTGGTLTYPLVGSPIPSGSTITISRNLAEVQDTVLGNQGPYFPSAVEQALDYLTMLLQQVSSVQNRALTVPVVDPAPLPLPAVAQRANQLLGFDAYGNPIASQPSSALVSTAMQPVVAAATTAIARTLLGLGTMATEGIGAALQDDGSAKVRVNFATVDDAVSVNPVPASYHLTRRDATGPITYTLSRANTYWNGFGFWISVISGGPVTVAIDSHDAFVNQSAGVSLTLQVGQFAFITTDAASSGVWYADIQGQANSPLPTNAQTGSSYALQYTDWSKVVTRTNAVAMTDSLPQATGVFGAGFWCYYQNVGATSCTITPSTSTINGASSFLLPPGYGVMLVSDGTNWQAIGTLPSTGHVLLNTLTASNSASLLDTTSFTTLFRNYDIVLENIIPASATNTLELWVHSGGVFPSTNYVSTGVVALPAGLASLGAITTHIPCGYPSNVGASAPGVSGKITVSNPLQITAPKTWYGQFCHQATSGPAVVNSGGYWNGANTAVDGFAVLAATGNLTSGIVRVYGWN